MKPRILLSLACAAGMATATQAQVLDSIAARNTLIGGIVGAVIGENNHHQALAGAAIGAASGLAWTALTHPQYNSQPVAYAAPCEPRREVYVEPCPSPARVVVVRPCTPPPTRVVIVSPSYYGTRVWNQREYREQGRTYVYLDARYGDRRYSHDAHDGREGNRYEQR